MIELPLKRSFSDSYVDGGENSGGQLDTVYLHSNLPVIPLPWWTEDWDDRTLSQK